MRTARDTKLKLTLGSYTGGIRPPIFHLAGNLRCLRWTLAGRDSLVGASGDTGGNGLDHFAGYCSGRRPAVAANARDQRPPGGWV